MRFLLAVVLVACVLAGPAAAFALGASAPKKAGHYSQPTPGQPTPGQPTPGQPRPGEITPAPTAGRPVTPPRAAGPNDPIPVGTAIIRGFVTASDTGTPLRRAQVRAFAQDGRGNGMAQTDAQGKFEITQLPAGRYSLSASKSGYVTMQFGQRSAAQTGTGTPIELADTQIAEKVSFVLPRAAAIGGVVVDEFGDPISTVQVTVLRSMNQGGRRRFLPGGGEGGNDRTDDRGSYRLYGLPPGEYYVSATLQNMQNFGPPGTQTISDGYAPTYYPGTTSIADAQRVVVRAGQDMQNISFGLVAARLSRVTGRVINSHGESVTGGQIMSMPVNADMPMMGMFGMTGGGQVRPDGTFQVNGLPPGRYQLTLRPMNFGPKADPNAEVGRVDITVAGGDIDNVLIVTGRGGTIRGHIVTDAGMVPPFKPSQMRLFPQAVDQDTMRMFGPPQQPTINDDWTFEIPGLMDASLVRATVEPSAGLWTLKSVNRGGTEMIDNGFNVPPGTVLEGVELVITDKITEISGLVTDDRNRPVVNATLIFFPSDRERWQFQSRYIRTARPGTDGRYRTRLTPGEDYLVVAVQELEAGRFNDPEFLESVRTSAKPFSIMEGENKTVDVKLTPVP